MAKGEGYGNVENFIFETAETILPPICPSVSARHYLRADVELNVLTEVPRPGSSGNTNPDSP